jgi:KEOPS complex subunit Cgi121
MEYEYEIRQGIVDIPSLPAFLESVREIAGATGTYIIFFDAERLAGKAHARKAIGHAMRSWREGRAIANSLEMEALLYAAGTRQCRVAMEIGLHEGENRCYVCICPPSPAAAEALSRTVRWDEADWEEIGPAKKAQLMERYAITEEELAAAGGRIRPLVFERIALLEVNR